jgi:hypothetical protein
MVERFDADRPLAGSLAALGLLLVKEDLSLLVAGFGVALAFDRRTRLEGVGLALFAAGAFFMIVKGIMPLAGASGTGFHWYYGSRGQDFGQVFLSMVKDPLGVLRQFVSPAGKLDTLVILLWTTLFACLRSPLLVAAVPMLAERFLGENPQWWGADHHYNAAVVVIVFCAGVDGIRRFGSKKLATYWAVAVCVVGLTLAPRFALGNLWRPDFYRGPDHAQAAREAVAAVPDGVTVEAANNVGPALSSRTTVLLWDMVPRGADWIVADTARWGFPFGSLEDQGRRVQEALESGYRKVYDRDGYVVLTK